MPSVNPDLDRLARLDIDKVDGNLEGNTSLVLGDVLADDFAKNMVRTLGDLRSQDAGRIVGGGLSCRCIRVRCQDVTDRK